MLKNDNIDAGFKIGDRVRHKKNGFEGTIDRLEWNGGERSALIPSGKPNRAWYIYSLQEIELIQNLVKEDMKPEPVEEPIKKKRGRKKKEDETGKSH